MSKYKTRRQQRQSRIRNTIRRVLLITGVLACISIAAFIYVKVKNREPVVNTPDPKTKNIAESKNDSAKLQPEESVAVKEKVAETDTVDAAKIEPSATAKDSSAKEQIPEKTAEKNNRKITDTARSVAAAGDTEKQETIKITRQQMMDIVQDVLSQKASTNNRSNCVTIRKTSKSNVENVFEIADLLKHNGFVISGRQTITGSIEGTQIDAEGSCIILTIGNLKTP